MTSQVTKPTATGTASIAVAPRCTETATAAIAASPAYTTDGAHHDRSAIRPAQAKTTPSTTKIPSSSSGLSRAPTSPMKYSASQPGVSLMTSSATATTGDSRIVMAMATK